MAHADVRIHNICGKAELSGINVNSCLWLPTQREFTPFNWKCKTIIAERLIGYSSSCASVEAKCTVEYFPFRTDIRASGDKEPPTINATVPHQTLVRLRLNGGHQRLDHRLRLAAPSEDVDRYVDRQPFELKGGLPHRIWKGE